MILFIEYPPCSTCKKAKRFLIEKDIEFTTRHIVEETPTVEELKTWVAASKLPLKRFFNTSGILYRELDLKNIFDTLSDNEKFKLLSENGMLIKRPILIKDNRVLVGFKLPDYQALFE